MRPALLAAAVAGLLATQTPARAQEPGFAPECQPPGAAPNIGTVDCQRFESAFMGGTTAFGYYVPPACEGARCPVLYYTHGTGGSYREGVQRAWVHALTHGPRVDPSQVPDPWSHRDPDGWIALDPIDMIIVSPHGRTVPGGFGPPPAGHDTAWIDWNPRYARDGDTPRYDTPPPRAHSFLVRELIPYIDTQFPTVGEREWRAIDGYSQGGFGSWINGFLSPDMFASMAMDSGGTFPLGDANEVEPRSPAGVPGIGAHTRLPGVVPTVVPAEIWQVPLTAEVTVGYGDPVADHVWYRGYNPADLATNVRASAGGVQSTHLRFMVGDAIPRRPEDVERGAGFVSSEVFESLLFPMSVYLDRLFERLGVERSFEIHPGNHDYTYRTPFFRQQLAAQYARVKHRDGSGSPPPRPTTFDYRTIERDFSVWGWTFHAERDAVEFLNLSDVTCDGLTLRGSGVVTVTPPASCGTDQVVVDLGPTHATDEPAGIGSVSAYGTTRRVDL